MKLEWKSSTTAVDGVSMPYHYLNTPTGVVLAGVKHASHVKIDGCNLTDEGEFVPAQGFGSCVTIGRETALIILNNMMCVRGNDLLSEDFEAALADLGWQLGEEVTAPNGQQGDVQG